MLPSLDYISEEEKKIFMIDKPHICLSMEPDVQFCCTSIFRLMRICG